jgi:hypothetical protein
MSVVHASHALIRVEAHDTDHAAAIVQTLVGVFDGGDVSLDLDRLQVEVRPIGDADEAVVRAVDALQQWLAENGPDGLLVHVAGRRYRIEPSALAPVRGR